MPQSWTNTIITHDASKDWKIEKLPYYCTLTMGATDGCTQSTLWPAFQCLCWHSFPQYQAALHRAHRFNGPEKRFAPIPQQLHDFFPSHSSFAIKLIAWVRMEAPGIPQFVALRIQNITLGKQSYPTICFPSYWRSLRSRSVIARGANASDEPFSAERSR